MPRLYLLSGPDLGKSVEITAGATVGRSHECTVHVRDASVSRRHAIVDVVEGRWTVVDLQSRNGLSVRGARVPRATLGDGDEFTLGDVLIRFRADAAHEGESTPSDSLDARVASTSSVASPPPASAAADSAREHEIELEGDWNSTGAVGDRPPPSAAPPPASAPPARSSSAAAPAPAREPRLVATRETAAARSPRAPDRARGVLQYHRVENRPGLANADLAQLSPAARLGLALLAVAVFAALFFAALRGTLFLKSRAPSAAPPLEDGQPDEPASDAR